MRHAQIDVGVVIELDRLRWIRVPLSHIVAVQQHPGVLREGIGSIEVDHGRSEALVEGRRLRSGGSRDVHQGRRAAQVDGSVRFGGGLQLEAPARRVRQRSGDEDRQARARIDFHAATADVVELAPEGRDGVADGWACVLQAAFRHVRVPRLEDLRGPLTLEQEFIERRHPESSRERSVQGHPIGAELVVRAGGIRDIVHVGVDGLEGPVSEQLDVVLGRRIAVQVERRGVLRAEEVVGPLVAHAEIEMKPVRRPHAVRRERRHERVVAVPVDVVGKEVPETVVREGNHAPAGFGHHEVEKVGIVPDIGENVREVPPIALGVVRQVGPEREVVVRERLLEGELVLERRERLFDVPESSRRNQPVRRVEGDLVAGGIQHVREEVRAGRAWSDDALTDQRIDRPLGEIGGGEDVERQQRIPLMVH